MRRGTVIILLTGLLLLGVVLRVAINHRAKEAYDSRTLIRLHVIANSDLPRDQEIKYRVRDALVGFLRPKFAGVEGYEEAMNVVVKNREGIARIAREALKKEGFEYPARVLIGRFTFPARAYGKWLLPAGEYEAVRVVLGEGKGANWWCVLFPPLCFVDISGSGEEMSATGGVREVVADKRLQEAAGRDGDRLREPVHLRLRIVDWLRHEAGYLAKRISS